MKSKKHLRTISMWIAVMVMASVAQVGLATDDTVYWTSQGDAFYHADRTCSANAEACYPISDIAAAEFDKQPCALCLGGIPANAAPEAKQISVDKLSATVRGGTWVYKIPQSVLESIKTDHSPDEDAEQTLVGLMAQTRSDVQGTRYAVPVDGAKVMNLRIIEGDAYIVVRPNEAYSDKHPLKWRVEAVEPDFFQFGTADLRVTGVSEVLTSVPNAKKQDYTKVFESKYTNMDVAVFRAMDTNIAVLHVHNIAEKDAQFGIVRIGEGMPDIPAAGYYSKKMGIFCCVLSPAELGALVAGAVPTVSASSENGSTTAADGNGTIFLPDLTLDVENGG